MTFKEAIVKMIEGKMMKNKVYDNAEYWFSRTARSFLMKTSDNSTENACFEEDEIVSDSWEEVDYIKVKTEERDLTITNFDCIDAYDRQTIFSILKKYEGGTNNGR